MDAPQRDPRDQPPPLPKTPGQVLDAALAVLMRSARASAHGWSALNWTGRFVVCAVGFAAVALLVSAIGGSARKPGDEATSQSPSKPTASKPKTDQPRNGPPPIMHDWILDGSAPIVTGDVGHISCEFAKIERIIDDQTCIVRPYGFVQWSDYGSMGQQTAIYYDYKPQLPILLKGWPTVGKVTGQKEDLSKTVFRVTGTDDVKKTDGAVVRVHVLEVVK